MAQKEKKGSGYKAALEKFRNRLRLGKIKANYQVKKGQTISDIIAEVYGDFIKSGTDAQWYARDLINKNNLRALKGGMTLRLINPRRYNPKYSPFDSAGGSAPAGKPKAPAAAKAPPPAFKNTGANPGNPNYIAPTPTRATTSNTRASNPELRDPTRTTQRTTRTSARPIRPGYGKTTTGFTPLHLNIGASTQAREGGTTAAQARAQAQRGRALATSWKPPFGAGATLSSGNPAASRLGQAAASTTRAVVGSWAQGYETFAGPRGTVAIRGQQLARGEFPEMLNAKDVQYLTQMGLDPAVIIANYQQDRYGNWVLLSGGTPTTAGGGKSAGAYVPMSGFAYGGGGYGGGGGGGGGNYSPISGYGYEPSGRMLDASDLDGVSWRI